MRMFNPENLSPFMVVTYVSPLLVEFMFFISEFSRWNIDKYAH